MGIKTNLQVFLDPDYSDYDADMAAGLGDNGNQNAADAWVEAIAPELVILLTPMASAQLVGAGIGAFILTAGDFDSGELPGAIDDAIDTAASTVFDISGACQAPESGLDSWNQIFDANPSMGLDPAYTPEEICQRAEDRIIAWLMTGTFTAFYYPPATGVPMTPWVIPAGGEMPEAPDSDDDGYDDAEEDEAGTDIEDPDSYPGSDD